MNLKRLSKLQVLFSAAIVLFSLQTPLAGQELSREVREKFETMLNDLRGSLKTKFENAIDNNTPVVELTPAEFRKFRSSPANPFDINDVNPDELDGNIELRFELPSLRNRPVKPFERQSRSLRRNLRSSVSQVARSTVRLTDQNNNQLALGAIVRQDGLIVSKASEINSQEELYCVLGINRKYKANILKVDSENDVALLKIDAAELTPVAWSSSQPVNGAFVVTPTPNGQIVALGSYSAVSRSTVGKNRAFLGVHPRSGVNGVEIISEIESDTAAFQAGLQKGDVILSVDGVSVRESDQLTAEITRHRAGDRIRIEYLRDGAQKTTVAKLDGRTLRGERAARFKMMSRLGAIPSERDTEFPFVFQHDSPLFPEQCGGPICDLAGNVVGLNIARESRAASYAIPASHIRTIVEEFTRFDVASDSIQSTR